MVHPLVGQKAPAITLKNYTGETYEVKPGTTGKPLAIFFYPQAGSAVCTKEACAFRDSLASNEAYKATGIEVVGISADPIDKQKKFVDDNKLTFPVLSDEDRAVRKQYKVTGGLMGLIDGRATFFVDAEGTILGVEDSTLNAGAHGKFVDKWLAKVQAK